LYYKCAGTTAIRPITERAQEYKKNTKIKTTNLNKWQRDMKSHLKIALLILL
jgi:hypothetical protein